MTEEAKYSKQPRFKDAEAFFGAVYRWVKMADIEEPIYKADSRRRDKWLRVFWHREPHLSGVLNSVVAIDKNRGWSIIGGRNQVARYTKVMHSSEAGLGWRTFFGKQSLSYYTSDMNTVAELGRDGRNGPLRALYHVDPAKLKLTGKIDQPINYYPKNGKMQNWLPDDFFRVSSLTSTDEEFYDLGFCAVSRCLELAKLMIAVYQHDQEKLGARAPKGLLLLQNITEDMWEKAMQERDEKLEGLEQKYYGSVAVLASAGMDQVDAKLVALSQLPDNFDQKIFTDLLMYGYALAFGYDPSEFWPVQFGSMGRGTETQVQHMKATGKGGLDFVLGYQEQLQQQYPDTLQFEFEQRDAEGERLDADVMKAKVDAVRSAFEAGLSQGVPLIERQEARSLLAEMGVIPHEWTEIEEDVEGTDVEDPDDQPKSEKEDEPKEEEPTSENGKVPVGERSARDREEILSNDAVLRAAETFQDEPIVRYQYPSNRTTLLFRSGRHATKPRHYPVAGFRERQAESGEIFYSDPDGEFEISELDVDRAIREAGRRVDPQMAELLRATELTSDEMADLGGSERKRSGLLGRLRKALLRVPDTRPGIENSEAPVHIHFHDADQISSKKRQEDENDTGEEAAGGESPTVIVNVPEVPVTVELDADFTLTRPDEVVETETIVERRPHDQRIDRKTSVSKTKRAK